MKLYLIYSLLFCKKVINKKENKIIVSLQFINSNNLSNRHIPGSQVRKRLKSGMDTKLDNFSQNEQNVIDSKIQNRSHVLPLFLFIFFSSISDHQCPF